MKRTAAILLLVATATTTTLPGTANGVTLWVTRAPETDYTDGLVITRIQAARGDWYRTNIISDYKNALTLETREKPGVNLTCSALNSTGCYNRLPPTTPCTTEEQLNEHLQKLVGMGWLVPKGATPGIWTYICGTTGGRYTTALTPSTNIIFTEAPVSCTMGNAQITVRGLVGERAKAKTTLNIRCDTQATVRLTLTDKGVVNVGGGGEVRLVFGKNGRDVLDVSGTAPLVDIEGELTKSPTTAGTYSGSSVLRLDIL